MDFFYFLIGFLAQLSQSQVTNIASKTIPSATISYKKTTACNASPNVVSYSGYVHLNSTVIPGVSYNMSTFFWFFPARRPAGANLALYLAGGPGEASSFSALTENGPGFAQSDGNSVIYNPFSFNENAHMLYVDQPNQVGFSYDQIIDGVYDALGGFGSGRIIPGTGLTNLTRIKGKFSSQNPDHTALTSTMAARNMWYFLRVFFADFGVAHGEKYSVSIWGNSYGGRYAASLASYILRTNLKLPVKAGATYKQISIPSVGITNGCVDLEAQAAAYASFSYNNTHDNPNGTPFRIYSKEQYTAILNAAKKPDGCLDQLQRCRKLKALYDPDDEGKDIRVSQACGGAVLACNNDVLGPFSSISKRSQFDVGLEWANPYPPVYAASYLNNPKTRNNLGVPAGLNYTLYSNTVFNNFYHSGDPLRKGSDDLTYLLNQGTRVAMIYGDRDWRCNSNKTPGLGAENLTLSLPWTPYPSSSGRFSSSGYVALQLPSSSSSYSPTAVTRQHTLLSFTRVFQAGHAVSWYAPETVQTIFNRVIKNLDVATGKNRGDKSVTKGKKDSWGWRLKMSDQKAPVECSLWTVGSSCTEAQVEALEKGTARVDAGWKVVSPAK